MRFDDQVILVTGGSRGIGHAIAIQFATRGGRVAVHYHQNRAAAVATLALLPGGPHLLVQADIADATAVAAMITNRRQPDGPPGHTCEQRRRLRRPPPGGNRL